MSSFEELAEAVKLRELSPEEVKFILQKVKELTNSNDRNLPNWTHLLGFVKEYQGYDVVFTLDEYEKMEKIIAEDFHLLSSYCTGLESIRFGMPDNKALVYLDLFPKLLQFHIDSASCLTEEATGSIWRLSQLTHLTLKEYFDIYDVFIQNLCQLHKLVSLDLSRSNYVFDHNLEQLSKLEHLRSLNLCSSIYITDDGMPNIVKMKNLLCLGLGGTHISDNGIVIISSLSKLKELLLHGCQITDEGLKNLISFQNLEYVDLTNCKNITNHGLHHLNNISKLRKVDLSYCEQITPDYIKQLSPHIKIIKNELKKSSFLCY